MKKAIPAALLHLHLIPALGAAAAIDTYSVFYPNYRTVLFPAAFTGTLFIYNLNRYLKFRGGGYPPETTTGQWMIKWHRVVLVIIILCAVLLTGFSSFLIREAVFYLGIAALPAIFYGLKILPGTSGLAIREIPFLKAFLVAGVWSYLTVLFPQAFQTGRIFWQNHWVILFFIGKFLSFFVITTLTDIRDMGRDNPLLRTMPQVLGIAGTVFMCRLLLLLTVFADILLFREGYLAVHLFAAFTFTAIYLFTITFANLRHKKEAFYSVWVDGVLVMQWFLALLIRFFI